MTIKRFLGCAKSCDVSSATEARVGSGHETTNRSVGPSTWLHDVALIGLTRHNQEIAQWSPDPFSCERVGSGHETTRVTA